MKILTLVTSIFSLALPAMAQTTTTVTSQPPAQPTTQVVVNPSDNTTTTTHSTVRVSDQAVGVQTPHTPRAPIVIVATDAVYGGLAGAVIGGGVALINQGDHWQRDLTVGAGAGILAGAAFGVYEAATQDSGKNTVVRAVADRDPAAHDSGLSLSAFSTKF